MDLQRTLTIITIVGFATTCTAGIASQVFKTSVEVNGHTTKQLTPAGWLWLGIALVGFLGSVSSELLRVRIKHDDDLRKQFEAAQQKALQEREAQWRNETSEMLAAAKKDITNNLDNTIRGFARTQKEFSDTQTQILFAKQSLIENSIQHMHEIILAGQPLTSLKFQWSFKSRDTNLRKIMAEGERAIMENAETSQGGVPVVPFDLENYTDALIPLISWISSGGEQLDSEQSSKRHTNAHKGSVVVLIPLDESFNTILSFGMIPDDDELWRWKGEEKKTQLISAGFAPGFSEARRGYSTPSVNTKLEDARNEGMSLYSIGWSLDPVTLAASVDRMNPSIMPTAKLPSLLKIAVIKNFDSLPFERNNFAKTAAENLWQSQDTDRKNVRFGTHFSEMTLSFEVNGFPEKKYNYVLKDMYKPDLMDDFDDEIENLECMIFEFELVPPPPAVGVKQHRNRS